ncbi:hypothetical protein MUY27_18035 [Mucilaginibacter sp. RS28]|uniref:Porin n=1 Tax=Mucilaginibacter straminoryzae TaxID=2932774 RepID=A0A9X1XBD5_9SPHI|nr:hypothetical protein [Mucilaginibacter straminoryzae]MCJ8211624.1 hypothetical protein [Mucilaginibacter straminoryzae]
MTKKHFYLVAILLMLCVQGFAQDLDIHFNGFGFLDNREYKAFIPRSRTYSGVRTALDMGLNLDSLNHFVVGVNGIHEWGAKPYFLKVDPVAYYRFESKSWLFNAGMFPREGLVSDFPRAMLNDTLRYYRPNIEGLHARYQNAHITFTGFLDWVSRQTNTDREQFIFGQSATYRPSATGIFYLKDYFMMLHDAGPAVSIPNDHIRDNGAAQVRAGLNLTKFTGLDSLSFEAGGMLSLERTRENNGGGFNTPKGFVASAYASYKRMAFYEEFYAGQGHHVTYGDSYYEKKLYNRLDIIYTPFLFDHIKGQFILSLHFSPTKFNDNQEAFRITYDLGRKKLVKFK